MEMKFEKIPFTMAAWTLTDDEIVYPAKSRSVKLRETYDWELMPPTVRGGDGTIRYNHKYWHLTTIKYEYRKREAAREAFEYARAHSLDNALNHEIRMRCEICGERFCYTINDIRAQQKQLAALALSLGGSLIAGLAGNGVWYMANSMNYHQVASSVKDYARCPHCQSKSLALIDDEPEDTFAVSAKDEKALNSAKQPHEKRDTMSEIEQVIKFKELFDAGILTEDEFTAKKKQILGI